MNAVTKSLLCLSLPLALGLTACGGDERSLGVKTSLAAPPKLEAVNFPGLRSAYTVRKTDAGYIVQDISGGAATGVSSSVTRLQFADASVNLLMADVIKTIPLTDLTRLIELYIAFFNRVPDADGLAYWITSRAAGQSMDQIAASFYQAGILYSDLTGFSATMSNQAFVNVIYKNVLGRADGGDAEGVAYWVAELESGRATRGSLISTILTAAHSYKGKTSTGYAWVADLLDNKLNVASYFSVQQGLTYNTPEEAISKGMSIALAVTRDSTEQAYTMIGLFDSAPFAATIPLAPSGLIAVAGNASASFSFTMPTANNLEAVSSYTLTCTTGAETATATARGSPIALAGLINGSSYACSMRAGNAVGSSTASSAINVTPFAGVSTLAACTSDMSVKFFNTSPIALVDFIAFRPLGFLSLPIHVFPAKHSAFSMTAIGQAAVAKPVVAPGRTFVTEIYEASFSSGGKNYQVFLRPCDQVRAYFGHLSSISDKLLQEFKSKPASCNSFQDGSATVTTCRREQLSLLLEEGEQFGAGPDSAGVDFGILDFRRTPAGFVNVSHYDYYYPYYTSPLDYFGATTKAQIESKTGNVFGTRMRTALPIGGSYMEDIAGTAQGNWFLPGKYHSNTTDLSIFLSLAHDYTDPSQAIISMGKSVVGLASGLYSFTTANSGLINRDFNAITPDGKIYCYESFLSGQTTGSIPLATSSGVLRMTMPDANQLKVEFLASGTCLSNASLDFSASATVFVR